MREIYTGHYEVNTYPENYTEEQELIRKNFVALADSRANHGEWLEHLEELIISIAAELNSSVIDAAVMKYYRDMDNL